MLAHQLLLAALLLPVAHAGETILGIYLYSRHGDRTSKSHAPTNLTNLGITQIYESGTYYRNKYIASSASSHIAGLSADVVKQSQIDVQAPEDTVLFNSALYFLQALFPPVSGQAGAQTLRNGTVLDIPQGGTQQIPVYTTDTGAGLENSVWLQGSSGCTNAIVSSNNYFSSAQYMDLLNSTKPFYSGLAPVVNGTFNSSQMSFKNAYAIFDEINVASIHNSTISSSDLLTPDTLFQLRTLADNHEFNLAYNSAEPIRAIAGATLAAQVVAHLNTTITGKGKSKISIQFGAYGSFLSFWGLAQLPTANPDFYGIPDYASSMAFELFTTAATDPFPAASDLQVRFTFHNGTTTNGSTPVTYPLFGGTATALPWPTFQDEMNKFAVGDQGTWCQRCGNSTGSCASSGSSASPAPTTPSASSHSGGGVSAAVGGVIGAFVTLGLLMILGALFIFVGGFRLIHKKHMTRNIESEGSPIKTPA